MTRAEIDEARRGIEWKANLYALVAELLSDAQAGDPMAMQIMARAGLVEPLRLVTVGDKLGDKMNVFIKAQ
ncbi:hypothetical protein [Pseudomonas peli]|uniref:hypothetical protein n=1 Tax=Pseudomonas peli TaxID=592361 RepID=UPI00285BB0C3|nr:hypothetical protein [Pseudomonas peli]MDR7025309.1 hypothetical protein [Pseudomonas peli]